MTGTICGDCFFLVHEPGVECEDCALRWWVTARPIGRSYPFSSGCCASTGKVFPSSRNFPNLRRLPTPPRDLSRRIDKSMELYPCDLLFVHRDTEGESVEKRSEEIREALEQSERGKTLPVVCVVPVRMQEAWLLIDESALKTAAGNPSSHQALLMPEVRMLEDLLDPKRVLYELLRQASGLQGRRLRRFNRDLGKCVQRVAQQIGDFRLPRELTAFRQLENQVERLCWVSPRIDE